MWWCDDDCGDDCGDDDCGDDDCGDDDCGDDCGNDDCGDDSKISSLKIKIKIPAVTDNIINIINTLFIFYKIIIKLNLNIFRIISKNTNKIKFVEI